MLHIRYAPQPIILGYEPTYISNQKSFIPTMEDDRIKGILEAKENKGAEQITKELSESKKGTTLFNAKITFAVAAAILAVFIVLTTALPNLVQR